MNLVISEEIKFIYLEIIQRSGAPSPTRYNLEYPRLIYGLVADTLNLADIDMFAVLYPLMY